MKSSMDARNFLLARRSDYRAAYEGFEWPKVGQLNWALDYFDAEARGNERTAHWIVSETGHN